ncbi:MAG TPA: tetratricopeptide repeat protein, partial [Pyrinomonadaceae bacterium]|nr:tetratricopeptide repeat protein [Pyrinomonadaceae bacterium]
ERAVALSDSPLLLAALGATYASAGRVEQAKNVIERLSEKHSHSSPYQRALIHVQLNERETALSLLREAYVVNDGWLAWLGVEPQLDPLRGEPAFEELLIKTRNPAVGRDAISAQAAAAAVARRRSELSASRDATTSPVLVPAEQTHASVNEEARRLYTAGRYYATRRSAEGLKQAIERLERAVSLDSDFALAHAELADCYALLNWFIEPPPPEAWQRAKASATRAVEADPELAEAHASLGFVRLHYDRDWAEAERELRKAILLKPTNQVAHRWYAYSLAAMGRHDEAALEIQRARDISPRSPVIATAVANVFFLAGRYEDAIEQGLKALDLDPGAVAAHTILRWAYEKKGMHKEALATFEHERSFAGDTPTTRTKLAHVLAAVGRHDEAREMLEGILARRQDEWVTAYEIAIVYAWLGDHMNALRWLSQAEREHAVGFTFVRVDPHLEALRSDPHFRDLLRGTDKTIP